MVEVTAAEAVAEAACSLEEPGCAVCSLLLRALLPRPRPSRRGCFLDVLCDGSSLPPLRLVCSPSGVIATTLSKALINANAFLYMLRRRGESRQGLCGSGRDAGVPLAWA